MKNYDGTMYDPTKAADDPVNDEITGKLICMLEPEIRRAAANVEDEWLLSLIGQMLCDFDYLDNPTEKEKRIAIEAAELIGVVPPEWATDEDYEPPMEEYTVEWVNHEGNLQVRTVHSIEDANAELAWLLNNGYYAEVKHFH